MSSTIPETHADLVSAPNTAVLTTVGTNSQPQSTAVWFMADADGTLKTSITTARQKYKNLSANPRATPFILDPTNPFRTIEIRATVDITPDPEQALIRTLSERYNMPADALVNPADERVILTFTPSRIVTNG